MKLFRLLLLTAFLAGCGRPPVPALVTLTAPAPTPTVAPVSLAVPMQIGSTMLYTDGATLVAVPSSAFVMGHGHADNPEHTVTLSDYWIYATDVTNAQFALCVAQERCTAPDLADNLDYSLFESRNRPVVGVTYDQAQSYCNYMNGNLPTEAQWEKAARGPDNSLYPWGAADPNCTLLNFNNCVKHTTDVTDYPKGKSYYGALDMEGNVREWVADWYDALYYKASPPGDPPGPADGRARVLRSSSYRSNPTQVVAYARDFASPRAHERDLGFRCVVSDPTFFAPSCALAPVIGEAELSSLSVDCPQISIDVQVSACRYGGGAIVTFNDDHPQDPNASFGGIVGCTLHSGTPGSYPLSYACKNASTAVMTTTCSYAPPRDAACPLHYTLDAVTGVCQWDGQRTTSIECATGDFFDPIHHCCSVSTGQLVDRPVCPVGDVFTDVGAGQYFCLPGGNAQIVPAQEKSINPPVCANNTCQLSADICTQRNLHFCSLTCACLAVGLKCPTH